MPRRKSANMALWETEDESPGPVASLPTPADTPYRTPSRNVSRSSRKSRRSVTPPGKSGKSSSPPPVPGERGSKRSSRDMGREDAISPFDPRRFTPTLHANLVSEILSLRRDQEEKIKIIEGLETSLHDSRGETETLQETLVATGKESRSLKRQLALLEGGTSSALGELARERDDAVESAADTKKRFEAMQKKMRSQEEDSERVHRQWAKEKDEWEEEKRKYERKVHVTETRLKAVLDEVAAYQAAQAGAQDAVESEVEEQAKDNDAASVRTMSMTNSIRFSMANGAANANGNSLADELGDGYDDESDYGGRESVLSNVGHNLHTRHMSRDSLLSRTHSHRRRPSNDSLMRPGSVARGRLHQNRAALELLEDRRVINEDDETPPAAPRANYVDTGIQFSPPPSPKIVPVKPSTPEPSLFAQRLERFQEFDSPPRIDMEIEANQRRKRVHLSHPLSIKTPTSSPMVNGSSQTAEEPLSPPRTPKTPYQETPPTPKLEKPAMVASSTQTDIPPPLQPSFLNFETLSIPSISIIPPTSRPTTPREPRLPQLAKDVGCQVSILHSVPMASVAVQTEEIRVDLRWDKLPAHLHPSAITSRPSSPALPAGEGVGEDSRQFTPTPGNLPPRNPRRLTTKRSLSEIPSSPPMPSSFMLEDETRDAYPGNNDDGPLSSQRAPMRRPHRISSLFAGFDGGSSDEIDEFLDGELSDSEYRTALSAPRHNKVGTSRGTKRSSGGTIGSTDQIFSQRMSGGRYSRNSEEHENYGSANVYSAPRDSLESKLSRSSSTRGPRSSMLGMRSSGMRKAAMIQNGIATHQRVRSPSLTDPKEPPFPIPTRASSRKPPVSVSAPSDGRNSPNGIFHRRGSSRSHYRSNSIRKVRSAAALPRNQRNRRQGSQSPPPFSMSTERPESPGLPPLPQNDITTPRNRDSFNYGKYKTHKHQLSTNTAETNVGSVASSAQATGVVDAIAQTMVGEWMFKYVRRRKSFGVADAKGGDETSNDRHKRWVWLAPYERAILWSSKQPASGSALMGKAGRKLTIQSVLDVKDDNPPPKGSGPLFNRSILILTPQRALKFTATNADRHYVWLTSLSFLAHSTQAIPESLIVPPMPPKPPVEEYELPKLKNRRPGIRDSIRLTKSKAAIIKSDPINASSSQIDSMPPSIPSYRPALPELPEPYEQTHTRDLSRDTAEPPVIARFHDRSSQVHGRKRSNTGGHVPPPLSFRGFSGPAPSSYHHAPTNSTAGNSIGTAGSSDIYSNGGASSAMGSSAMGSGGVTWATGSVRTSEASSRPSGPVMSNFFDAIGTVRMEAFISPMAFNQLNNAPSDHDDFRRVARRRSKELRRKASRSRQRDSYQSRQRDSYQSKGTRGTDDLDEWFLRDDPFRGF